ncbi:MAG: hypothetical protein GXO24_05380 [Chlorobi bacterium]|nr:hypothetical protein [Chlorobiota bacterium]
MRKLIFFIFMSLVAGSCSINKENLDYRSHAPQITPEEIKRDKPNSVIIFIDPGCPGTPRYAPEIRKELDMLKRKKVDYTLVADMLYTEKVDHELDDFKKKYGYDDETIFLMNVKKYPKYGILKKKRFMDFMNDVCPKCDTLPLGPGLHVFLKDGKYYKHQLTYSLSPEDVEDMVRP